MNKSEKFWDRQSIRFEKQVKKDEQSFDKIIKKVKNHLKEIDIVLDFACGIGTSSFKMSNYVKEVHAIDISSGMINVAKKRNGELNKANVSFEKANIFDEQFKTESFDVITAFNILHLLEDPSGTIQKIYHLLKPGGLFISSTPCLGENGKILNFIFFLLSKTGLFPNKIISYKIAGLNNIISNSNFEILETKTTKESVPNQLIVASKL